jgi:tetratricopeptide (TPR) repeat protein
MEVYTTPLVQKETSIHESVSSILFYSIALTQVRRGQYETALTWLDKEFSRIQSFDASHSGRPLIQILHNMGYCSYRLGQNTDSIQHFQQALSLKIQIGADETAVAASLNCLNVLRFHRHADDAEKAMDLLKQSLAIYLKCLGSMTKEVATVLNNIGRVYYLWSECEQALEIYGEALKPERCYLVKTQLMWQQPCTTPGKRAIN